MQKARRVRKHLLAVIAAVILGTIALAALPVHGGTAHWYIHTKTAGHGQSGHWFITGG